MSVQRVTSENMTQAIFRSYLRALKKQIYIYTITFDNRYNF